MSRRSLSSHRASVRGRLGLVAILLMPLMAPCAGTPPAPPDHIHDDARALPDAMVAPLAGEIRAFEAATGCRFYLATISFLEGKTIRAHADTLARAWIKGGPGVVLGFDRGSASFSFAPDDTLWRHFPAPALVEVFTAGGVTLRNDKKPLEERLVEASRQCMRDLARLERLSKAQSRVLSRKDRYLALGFLAALLAASVGAAVIITRGREQEIASSIEYFFPAVEVGARLGAPHGGGVMAEARF